MSTTEVANLVFNAETDDLTSAKKKLDNLAPSAKKVEMASSGVTRAFRAQKGATQQAAFQIQDFAVQVGSGQSALRAFNQQAPQFLSIFGPAGAVLGGVVAVGAALAGVFFSGLLDAKDGVEVLTEAMTELEKATDKADDGIIDISKNLRELEQVSKVAFAAEITEQIFKAEEALEKTRLAVRSLVLENYDIISAGAFSFAVAFNRGEISARELADAFNELPIEKTDKEFRAFRTELEQIAQSSTKVENRLGRLREALETGESGSTGAERKAEDNLIKKEQSRINRLAQLEAERARREEARDLEATQSRLFRLEDSFRTQDQVIQDKYNEQEALIRAGERKLGLAEEDAAALRLANQEQFNRAAQRLDMARLSSMSGFFGQTAAILSDGLGEQNALSKAAFAAQKLLAIPQMIVAVQQGVSQALALGPLGLPLAGLIGGLGSAAIGTVVGTTLAGRAQGGQVRPGEAYRVGEYGPETLVMGTSGGFVSPNSSSNTSGSGMSLVTNVKVIGMAENVPVNTTLDRVSDEKWVQNIVIGQMSDSQSPGFRGMMAKSNLQPRGAI